MEDHIQRFIDLLGEYKTDIENKLFIGMFLKSYPEGGNKEQMLRVIKKFNEHGVSTKILFEVCAELVKEGVFE